MSEQSGEHPHGYQQLPPRSEPMPSGPGERPREARASDQSVGALVAQLGDQVSRLVRDELELAEAEAKQRAKRAGAGIGGVGFAGLLAFFGAAAFVTAAILAFSMIMRPWAAALVVGAFAFVFSGFFGGPGLVLTLRGARGVGRESVRSVKADVETVREAVRR